MCGLLSDVHEHVPAWRQRPRSPPKASSEKKRGRPKKAPLKPTSTMDNPDCCHQVQSIDMKPEGTLQSAMPTDKPVIIRVAPERLTKDFTNALDTFSKRFMHSDEHKSTGRMQRKFTKELQPAVDTFFLDNIPKEYLGDPAKLASIAAELIPTMFAVAAKRETAFVEANHWGALRYGYKGTRRLLLVQTLPLVDFLRKQQGGKQIELQGAYEWLKTSTAESVRCLASGDGGCEVPCVSAYDQVRLAFRNVSGLSGSLRGGALRHPARFMLALWGPATCCGPRWAGCSSSASTATTSSAPSAPSCRPPIAKSSNS